ncbi:PAS domain S-box protein [Methylobacterium radiodurans]|uniref:PAS domain S-box protein n=1 Tax=Methylobacterium radiodurans TaxID=2202828 RepID=UPI001FE8EA2F|nr:PAS domain-containing protein [Methylobacterium radiodurans]
MRDDAMVPRPDLELFKAAVEAAGEAIVITSADLDELGPFNESVNPAFTRMTGYEAREVQGRSPLLLQGTRMSPERGARPLCPSPLVG